MTRYNRFKMLSSIQDEYILESLPDYVTLAARKRRKESSVIRFFNSGWGVACICALVAVGVMAFIIRAGQGPWTPPGGTMEESELESPTAPTTEEPTEEPTEADTTPYFDPELLDIDTYQGMTPDIPYKIVYHSLGDGTCVVTNVIINILYEGDITIEIPETSPADETVVDINLSSNYNIPTYVLAEDFEKIKNAMLAHYDNDENNFYYKQFMSYFGLRYAENAPTPEDREKWISNYPLCEFVPVYVFAPAATTTECVKRSEELREVAPWYTAEWCYSDLLKAKSVADELGVTDPTLEEFLKKHSDSLTSVVDIKLPKTLEPYDGFISIDLYVIARMGIKQMTFEGTVAEMTAIADPENYELSYPLTIHCTDGDIVYPVKE
ncbi:MAG: hypothetical protein IJW00_06060 [Clostridia bacterium]|nr:hypothetical protein [Clostridia bacterium]